MTREVEHRRQLLRALLILCLPLTMGQLDDCNSTFPPRSNARPLALDCVADGTQIFMPLDMTAVADRPLYALKGGALVDTTVTVRIPAAMFCAMADAQATQTDIESGSIGINFDGVRAPGDFFALHTAANLPIQNIDIADACAGTYGPDILVDFGTAQSVAWPDEAWTMDVTVAPSPASLVLLKNIDLPGLPIPGPTVDLLTFCDPTDKSEPPNGTTDDPEDSPRFAADRDSDGVYESLADMTDQIRLSIQGYCAGYRCNDLNDCTIDTCNPDIIVPWGCSWDDKPDGTSCDFGGQPGVCSAGTCIDSDPTCTSNADCQGGSFCVITLPASCVSGSGMCEPPPGSCSAIVDPVCGCDGVTYSNYCDLLLAGVRASALGSCECTTNADCGASEYCNAVTCDGPGSCTVIPISCSPGPGNVVACDAGTYDSVCAAAAAGVRVGGELYPPSPF